MSNRRSHVRPATRRAAICVRGAHRRDILTNLRACHRFAEAKGWRVVAVFLDPPPTASASLQRLPARRLEAGEFDGVVAPTKAGMARILTRRGSR